MKKRCCSSGHKTIHANHSFSLFYMIYIHKQIMLKGMLTRGDLIDSDQQENHYKKRSERHQKKKPLQNEETPKTRSNRHAKKQSMNNEPEQHIDEQLEEDQSQAKTRSERHH